MDFRAGEEMKLKMVDLSRTNRIVETQLSELTAESARNLTSASQLKRNHQITINQLEDDHQNEIQNQKLKESTENYCRNIIMLSFCLKRPVVDDVILV